MNYKFEFEFYQHSFSQLKKPKKKFSPIKFFSRKFLGFSLWVWGKNPITSYFYRKSSRNLKFSYLPSAYLDYVLSPRNMKTYHAKSR